jgi:ATP-dependent exoDNAse (exonuclease V) beta subunit
MVAVTFTDAAAGELKLRLRKAIEDARRSCAPEVRARLDATLPQLEETRIGTIHSFCADLLRERPVEAGVDPLFTVAPRDVAEALLDRAFERWFEEQLAAPGEAVRRILRRRAGDDGPRTTLRNAARELIERRDFPAPWGRADGFDRDAAIDALVEEMTALGAFASSGDPDDYFVRSLAEIARFADDVRRRETMRPRDHDGLEAELRAARAGKHWRWTGFRRASPGFPKAELLDRRTRLRAALDDFVRRSGADLAPHLRDELWPVVEGYESLKRRAGCLDFLDLLLRARDLVRDNAAVRAELQRRFTHLFVDEFQDTDPLQAEILLLLADDRNVRDWRLARPVAGKLFLVGDPKQSIYRFRRADVELYERVKQQLVGMGAARVDLSVSFRAVPEIQEIVNAAFAPRMESEPRYVPLSPCRADVATQPGVIALPVPAPYGDFGTIVDWRVEESLPDAIAAFVEWLVKSDWTVTERDRPNERLKVQSRHVCLLFRRFRSHLADVTRPYVRALEARHLPHLLVGGTSFHVREEVEAIRNALAAIERPEDELAVFATLHGPFFALGDGALLAFRERYRSLHPFRADAVPDDAPPALREVRAALEILRGLHRGRNRRPIADTIGRLLEATRAHAGLAVWPTGEQALANVTRLMDLARRAERAAVTSFRGFVEWLGEQAEHGEAGDAPIVEEGTEGVRMMTVHGAKGLEFPVVILADLTCKEMPGEPRRWVDADRGLCVQRIAGCTPPELEEHAAEETAREAAEATRVLYVAATRARDLVVVPALGDGRYEGGWLAALDGVLYPAPDRVHGAEAAPGCPPFGGEATPRRPERVPRPPDAVVPGRHVPEVGRHRVVWWDPTMLALDVEESAGLTQQTILAADERGVRTEEGIRAHATWQRERVRVREVGAVPARVVQTATEQAARGGEPAVEVVVESVDVPGPRPHGTRFGTLVHAVLAAAALDADRASVADVTALQGRLLGATDEEVEAAIETTVRALAHPVMRRAAAAGAVRCRRESPVGLTLDGVLVEGVVDAAFLEDDGAWTVVDFKTDVEIAGRLDEYRRQVALYAQAVAHATQRAARGVLLRL